MATYEELQARATSLLKEYREVMEQLSGMSTPDVEYLRKRCATLKSEGTPIKAIALYRDETGCTLTEAKAYIDAL